MKIVTWNVNGLRACIDKGLLSFLSATNADIVGLQEIKTGEPVPELVLPGYAAAWNCSARPGYSGTVCLFKAAPESVQYGFGEDRFDAENRLITLEYRSYYFVNVYVPTSQGGLDRWYYRLDWDTAFLNYLKTLQQYKSVIIAGDFNVAHNGIDIYPENQRNVENPAGFTPEERDGFNAILASGFVDVYRELHPAQEGAYTWWSAHLRDRDENKGRRIDYILVSGKLRRKIKSCEIRADINGSDHAPVEAAVKG
ncbi:exodeoxyribonuclease III [Fibrobacteres bacterium R8-0-B4]